MKSWKNAYVKLWKSGEKVREFGDFLDESEKMISGSWLQLQLAIYTKA
jgi:hypothetical protein